MRLKNLIVKNKLKLLHNSELKCKSGYLNGTAKVTVKDKNGRKLACNTINSVSNELDRIKHTNTNLNKYNNTNSQYNVNELENSDRIGGG